MSGPSRGLTSTNPASVQDILNPSEPTRPRPERSFSRHGPERHYAPPSARDTDHDREQSLHRAESSSFRQQQQQQQPPQYGQNHYQSGQPISHPESRHHPRPFPQTSTLPPIETSRPGENPARTQPYAQGTPTEASIQGRVSHGAFVPPTSTSETAFPRLRGPIGSSLLGANQSSMDSQDPQHGSYRMMTFESDGNSYSVPVDTRAASKVADEKRRRNAGASARFRARRKEKEHQSSKEIEVLKMQIHDAGEDAAFYRSERDYFRSVVQSSISDADRYLARPTSPRHARSRRPGPGPDNQYSFAESPGSSSGYGYEETGQETDGRYDRRRMSSTGGESQQFSPSTSAGPVPSSSGSSYYPSGSGSSYPAYSSYPGANVGHSPGSGQYGQSRLQLPTASGAAEGNVVYGGQQFPLMQRHSVPGPHVPQPHPPLPPPSQAQYAHHPGPPAPSEPGSAGGYMQQSGSQRRGDPSRSYFPSEYRQL